MIFRVNLLKIDGRMVSPAKTNDLSTRTGNFVLQEFFEAPFNTAKDVSEHIVKVLGRERLSQRAKATA